jgi:fumarylacetoacetase
MNDWSARDIQAFEYVPLGPFLGKVGFRLYEKDSLIIRNSFLFFRTLAPLFHHGLLHWML